MSTVFIAIGNSLRRDDGVAHRVLELLGPVANVVMRGVLQLTPELAGEIAEAGKVVFIDADLSPGKPRVEPLGPDPMARSPLGHAMPPHEVVALSRSLYDFRGQAYLCHVPGVDFSEGESVSPEAEANAKAAADLLRKFILQLRRSRTA